MESVEVLKPADNGGDASVKTPPGLFTSHCAHLEAGPSQFTIRVLKMQGSTILFVNSKESEVLEELGVAMPARDPSSGEAISSTILGGYGQTDSSVLAAKLSKRYGRQFYVSMNLRLDRLVAPLFDKALVTYMRDHLEHFV